MARAGSAHPLGNFSISQYAGIRVERDAVELRYVIDLAEIPTFQEIQDAGIVPEVEHPGIQKYLVRKAEALRDGLHLEIDGRRMRIQVASPEILFPPGAGGLPTLKLGFLARATLDDLPPTGLHSLRYRHQNFPDRVGWKEIVAVAGRGVVFEASSVPETDRSRQLADYPMDLLNSPPQDLEARILFRRDGAPVAGAPSATPSPAPAHPTTQAGAATSASPPAREAAGPPARRSEPSPGPPANAFPDGTEGRSTPPSEAQATAGSQSGVRGEPLQLEANKQRTPRSTFTDLLTKKELGFGIIVLALAVAAGLGAAHALEPGHGKTVVAAYLVGSRGTAWHAFVLGLVVTISHTAGVFLLGAVTLYASRYIVPERLYPWLGVLSGLLIAGLGFTLFLRRYAGHVHSHHHDHAQGHPHHHHAGDPGHHHHHGHEHHHHHHDHPTPGEAVTLSGLLALGVSGGIVPCPAALVVLLSAVSLNRIGFGLLLIAAFSVGLAAVLIAIGLLMVYARRFMSRFHGEGLLITRWLPLTSAAVITLFGVGIAIQALVTAGILQIRL
jgi:ABC-type nickel/cobalt efflux system permease component RcnA